MVEVVVISLLLLIAIGAGAMYRHDRAGWNATFAKLSRIVRANLEASKPVKELTMKAEKHEVTSWERDFKAIEKPQDVIARAPKYGDVLVEPRKLKHAIVKRTYKKVSTGEIWPQAVCKCGWTGHTPTGIWSERETLKRTGDKGDEHVKSQNAADAMLAKSKGNFAW